jgi:hypothetical protein
MKRSDSISIIDLGRRADHVVDRSVVSGVGVGVGAHPFDHIVVFVGGVALRAAKHHVLEEVGKTAVAGLHLVAGAGADNNVVGNGARAVVGNHHHLEPVVQSGLVDLEGEDVVCGHRQRHEGNGEAQANGQKTGLCQHDLDLL